MRKNLRKVFLTITAAAAAIAVVMIARLAWLCWEENRFEALVAQVQVGMTPDAISELLGSDRPVFIHYSEVILLPHGNGATPTALAPFFVGRHWYCVYVKLEKDPAVSDANQWTSQSVQVFRLPAPPSNYRTQTEIARLHVEHGSGEKSPLREDQGYIWDFYEFLTRRRKDDVGIRYRTIHTGIDEPTYDTDLVERSVNALNSKQVGMRRVTAEGLRGVGIRHHLAVPALVAALEDDDEEVRRVAAASLEVIDPATAARASFPRTSLLEGR